jgi:hypothetical protein
MSSEKAGTDHPKPGLRKAVRVWLENGTRIHAMWIGDRWWSAQGEVSPIRWELEERHQKTKKISKSLPGNLAV